MISTYSMNKEKKPMISKPKSVVLIPGFMLNDSLWNEFADELPRDWNIIKASLLDGDTIPEIAQNIARITPKRSIVIGFSLGGYIARSLAEQFPEKVDRLILIASSSRPDSQEQRNQKLTAIKLNTKETFRGLSSISIKKTLHPMNSNNALIKRIQDMGKNLGYDAFVKQSLLSREASDMNKILCPTLIILGDQDQIRSKNEVVEMFNQIKFSSLEVVENTGHMIPIEQPKILVTKILNWMIQKNVK